MTDAIQPGTILVEPGTLMPESIPFEREPESNGWRAVGNAGGNMDHRELEGKIHQAGWTLFYMAGEIQSMAFGSDGPQPVHAALKRIIASVKSEKCNSVEVTKVTKHTFLKIPYVTVSAHARHIQKGMVFHGR